MLDYLLALLRALLESLLSLFNRLPAAKWLQEWLQTGFRTAGPLAGFFLVSVVTILGTLAVVVFFWILRRRPLDRSGAGPYLSPLPLKEEESAPDERPR